MKETLIKVCAISTFAALLLTPSYARVRHKKAPIVVPTRTIFIAPPQKDSPGFNLTLQSAIFSDHLPFTITEDSSQADYLIEWQASTAQTNGNAYLFFGEHQNSEVVYTVSVSLIDKNKQVVWSGSVDKVGLNDGANAIALQLKRWLHKQAIENARASQ